MWPSPRETSLHSKQQTTRPGKGHRKKEAGMRDATATVGQRGSLPGPGPATPWAMQTESQVGDSRLGTEALRLPGKPHSLAGASTPRLTPSLSSAITLPTALGPGAQHMAPLNGFWHQRGIYFLDEAAKIVLHLCSASTVQSEPTFSNGARERNSKWIQGG